MTDAFKAEAGGLHSSLRRRFLAGETRGYEWRRKQLKTLGKLLEEHSDSLIGAIVADLKRPWSEAAMEVKILQREINDALRNLRSWMRPTWHWTHMLVAPAKQEARPEPLGSALVIGPYNYPVNLLISPLIGALSAGCNVMLKPSEISKSCERLFSELIPRYFEREDVCCVTGGVPETTTILALNWDFVFFTGSRKVGKVVASACAQHLTPNVLELGGKAAALVDSSVTSVTEAAKRIVWTKFVNAGQTCMCPDYVICHESVVDELCEELLRWTKTFYGESPKASPDFARLVSPAHARHVVHMLEESDGEVLCGGLDAADEEACYVPPTIIKNPTLGRSAVLSKEIFGPVLPVITFSTFEDSVDKITTIDAEPLALYIFSGSTSVQERYLAQVRSGDAIINDCFVQAGLDGVPFGGVGNSGYGCYHGKASFDAFSYKRGVVHRHGYLDAAVLVPTPGSINIRYPPDNPTRRALLPLLVRYAPALPRFLTLGNLIGVTVLAVLITTFKNGMLKEGLRKAIEYL